MDSVFEELGRLTRDSGRLCICICRFLLLKQGFCNGLVDKFAHGGRLLGHDGLPLGLHLVKHLSRLLQTFLELFLFLGFTRLHRAQHRLLRADLADLVVHFLQVLAQLAGQLLPDLGEEHLIGLDLLLQVRIRWLIGHGLSHGRLASEHVRIWVLFEVGLSLVVRVEVDLGVRSSVVLLQVLLRDKELAALFALEELAALLGWQFEQVLVGRQSLLLQSELLLEHCVLSLLLLYGVPDPPCLLVRLLVVQV